MKENTAWEVALEAIKRGGSPTLWSPCHLGKTMQNLGHSITEIVRDLRRAQKKGRKIMKCLWHCK